MYSVGYIPVLVGGAAVFALQGVLPWARLGALVAAALCIIAWLNLSNDAFDAATGVDVSKPESVVNLTGSRPLVFWSSLGFLAAGVSLLLRQIAATGDSRVTVMLALAISCGYVYQGPPFRLSYKGVGELLCFIAFGLLATPAFFLALQPDAAAAARIAALPTASVWALGCLVGTTTSIILFTSHFHQIEGDRAAGKMSPLVRLGAARAYKVLVASVAGVYLATAAAAGTGLLPPVAALATLASLPASNQLLRFAQEHHLVPARIAPLKKFACGWHIGYGASLAAGLLLSRGLP
ncbi:UbiA prenyltransferase family [Haematococcus lacustris]